MCDPSTSKQLIIALESDCLSMYMLSQAKKHLRDGCFQFGVVNCGDSKVEIGYYHVENREGGNFVLNELAPLSVRPYNCLNVYEAFERLLEPVFGADLHGSFFKEMRQKNPAAWVNWTKVVKDQMSVLDKKKNNDVVWFDITYQFDRCCQQITGKDAFSLLSQSKVDGITLSTNDLIQVRAGLIKALFQPIIDAVCKCLNADLAQHALSNVRTLFIFGTFSNCRYFFQSVCDRLSARPLQKNIISPPECSFAVVKGAALYGINPSIVQVAARSYGLGVVQPFSMKHPESKAMFYNGLKYCEDCYEEFVKCGQICSIDEHILRLRSPVEPDQHSMCIKVYSAPHAVTYIDSPGCEYLDCIVVNMPDLKGGVDRCVHIEIELDGSAIHVVAKDENTGNLYDLSLELAYTFCGSNAY